MKIIKESILDFPQETLNPSIWNKSSDGSYVLRDDVASIIQEIVDWVQETFQIPQMNVNITGSNTSNRYSTNSDLDVHFNSPKFKKEKTDDFNKIFRKKFEDLIALRPELGQANGIRIEVYMQPNPFQDLMSVGCYDFLNKRWLVGPELKDTDFDPYAEYFMKDLKSVDDIIDSVRSIILQMYELSLPVLKAKDEEFKVQTFNKLSSIMKKAKKMFDALRKRRTHKSSPKDAEEAAKNRNDKDWQVADSAFKLLDKFGYMGVLKAAAKAVEEELIPEEAAQSLIDAITEKISSKVLDDSEKEFISLCQEVEMQNESVSSMLKLSAIAALMSIGSLLPATALAKELKRAKAVATQQGQKFTSNSHAAKDAVKKAANKNVMVGPMTKTNVVNAISQVLWKEARGEGEAGVKAVASVILNRTGNDPSYIIDVIKMKKQFSCLNSYTGGWTDVTYEWYNPSVASLKDLRSLAMWETCKKVALQLVDRKFTSTIGNRNVYLNPDTADQSAIDSWGKDCDKRVGNHVFGYKAEYDPRIVKPGTFTSWKRFNKGRKFVVVKRGDTLGKIARENNITIDKILALNTNIKNKDAIMIGQRIRVA